MLGIRTWGRRRGRMEGADEPTVLWRSPPLENIKSLMSFIWVKYGKKLCILLVIPAWSPSAFAHCLPAYWPLLFRKRTRRGSRTPSRRAKPSNLASDAKEIEKSRFRFRQFWFKQCHNAIIVIILRKRNRNFWPKLYKNWTIWGQFWNKTHLLYAAKQVWKWYSPC